VYLLVGSVVVMAVTATQEEIATRPDYSRQSRVEASFQITLSSTESEDDFREPAAPIADLKTWMLL
jgi:hypothetical protein